MKLITHSGNFHADDVLAYTILCGLERFKDHTLIRTRDDDVFASASDEDVIFDVGFEFDPERQRFDHHMADKPLRDDGTPYSSVGLIWKYYGRQYLEEVHDTPQTLLDTVWRTIDDGIIRTIDLTDNGLGEGFRPTSFSVLIDEFNLSWENNTRYEDSQFKMAVKFANGVFDRKIEKAISNERAYSEVLDAIKNSENPELIVLQKSMPWVKPLHDHGFDQALYVVFEKPDGWYLESVRTGPDTFELRKPLPAEWGGKRNSELAEASGIDDAIFCHAGLFLCAAKSKESIMKMAQMALGYQPVSPKI